MNKKLKKILATVSAVAMCATSVVSMGAGAGNLFVDKNGTIYEECTDFGYSNIIRTAIDDNSYAYYKKGPTRDERYTALSDAFFYFDIYSRLNEEKANELSEFLAENYPSFLYECENHDDETFSIEIDYPEELSDKEQMQIAVDIYKNVNVQCAGIVLANIVHVPPLKMLIPEPTLIGDANEDGDVNMADAVLIMQTLSNPDEYKLTPQGIANADMDGDGVTAMDALTIQLSIINQ